MFKKGLQLGLLAAVVAVVSRLVLAPHKSAVKDCGNPKCQCEPCTCDPPCRCG